MKNEKEYPLVRDQKFFDRISQSQWDKKWLNMPPKHDIHIESIENEDYDHLRSKE